MRLGYKLIAEAYSPTEIVDQAVRAEQAGFDFVEVSDHFHPWVPEHEHSGFAFSMLAAAAARTSRIELATGVTCPFIRYHPAIVAQAAATTALLAGGRFTLGLGAGERLNEHVVGQGWPAVAQRHEMLREAIEIIRLLWSGGYQSYEGKHLRLEDARVFDLPDPLPRIAVAAGGPAAARLAGEVGDALFTTEPRADLVTEYRKAGGQGPRYAEVPLAWAPSAEEAAESARRLFRFGVTGWKVQAELPNPVNFDAATKLVTADHMAEQFGCGPDVERHVEVAKEFVDADYDNLALINAGPDPDGFFAFFEKELGPALREL
ncbi:TIGR03557 family F420-dependent LLM class oxidoreductase [Kribbella sp. NPDC023855]|uniref:TIGR03557 family F420-dependent LLM class oxidoreductase n=1 Tax=Kribbella sp. NPDC023855 TaxID=3154698 RepID=UPI0033EDA5A6